MPNPLLTVLLPFCLSPIVSFLFRIVNATIAPDLIVELDLDPATLGLLTSAYFVGFGLAQIPLGLLLDRFGPRRVAACFLLVGAVGAAIFAAGHSVPVLMFGRMLMGVGMAVSVMAGLKAANLWWPRERLPLLNALLFGMTGVGGMLATVPLAALLHHISWREAVAGIGGVSVLVAAAIAAVVPDKPGASGPPPSLRAQLAGLARVYGSALFWRYTAVAMATIGAFAAYQSLWAALWLRDIAGEDRAGQAFGLFLLLGGLMAGNFAFGALTQILPRWGVRPITAVLAGLGLFLAVQLALALQAAAWAMPLWFAFGALSACPIALYAILAQRFPVELSGRVNTAMNLMVFCGSFSFQWGIGIVLNQFPIAADGTYDPAGHRLAFLLAIGVQIAAIAWFLKPRRQSAQEIAA